mmetsp:Transcript_22352/g.31280  ORF Transcript_22352/g.31280 Transcript_22352/m.31280 type:complete len:283 (-) Transcript_22352:131-979(-)
MTQAVYFSSGSVEEQEYQHYGLAAPIYTHFTSPIRRYSDILVHRLLAAALRIDPVPTALENEEKSRSMCEHMNHRNRMAQQVGRSSSALYTLLYFRERDLIEEGIVLSVRKNGIRVFLPKFGIEGSIAVVRGGGGEGEEAVAGGGAITEEDSDDNGGWKFDPENLVLEHAQSQTRYQIFDRLRIRVYVKSSEMRREWLEMEIPESETVKTIQQQQKHNKNKKGEDKKLRKRGHQSEGDMDLDDDVPDVVPKGRVAKRQKKMTRGGGTSEKAKGKRTRNRKKP